MMAILAFNELKIPNHHNYFPPKKTHILSQLPLKRLKNTQVFLILKKESWFSFFNHKTTQEELWKIIRDLNTKNVARRVTLPPKVSNWIPIFSQIWFTNILTIALIKLNFPMIWNMLIQYTRQITNAKKKTANL